MRFVQGKISWKTGLFRIWIVGSVLWLIVATIHVVFFWKEGSLFPTLLQPLAALYQFEISQYCLDKTGTLVDFDLGDGKVLKDAGIRANQPWTDICSKGPNFILSASYPLLVLAGVFFAFRLYRWIIAPLYRWIVPGFRPPNVGA
jgi:hypothetical protein